MVKRPVRRLTLRLPKPKRGGECMSTCPLYLTCPFVRRLEMPRDKVGYIGYFPGKGCPWFKEVNSKCKCCCGE